MKIKRFLFCIIVISFLIIQCSKKQMEKKEGEIYNFNGDEIERTDSFKIIYIDTLFLSHHSIYIIKSSEGKKYFLYSKKYIKGYTHIDFKKYEEIKEGNIYKFTIKKSDTIPEFYLRSRLCPFSYSIANTKIIQDNKPLITTFTSRNINTRYIEILK